MKLKVKSNIKDTELLIKFNEQEKILSDETQEIEFTFKEQGEYIVEIKDIDVVEKNNLKTIIANILLAPIMYIIFLLNDEVDEWLEGVNPFHMCAKYKIKLDRNQTVSFEYTKGKIIKPKAVMKPRLKIDSNNVENIQLKINEESIRKCSIQFLIMFFISIFVAIVFMIYLTIRISQMRFIGIVITLLFFGLLGYGYYIHQKDYKTIIRRVKKECL